MARTVIPDYAQLLSAAVTAHNHVLRRWLRGDTDDAEQR
jgi:hypothetical protein